MEIGLSVKINGGTYGIVHRSVMSDVRLTLESKAIYALLTTECDEFNQVVISNKELSELLEVGEKNGTTSKPFSRTWLHHYFKE